MPLLLAGIDEAGYGPLLGPLCVGLSTWFVHDWSPGQPAPDLWALLADVVAKKPRDAKHRLPIADSKALKLPNDAAARHPLTHLERGVLVVLRSLNRPVDSDAALFADLGVVLSPHRSFAGPAIPLPIAGSPDALRITANLFARGLAAARCRPVDLRAHAIAEPDFNDIVRHTKSKASTTLAAIQTHLLHLLTHTLPAVQREHPDVTLRVVCDRLGGRAQYTDVIAAMLPGAEITTTGESERVSRYTVRHQGAEFGIGFETESEAAHLPVALASMTAKYVRELAMTRFNRYWSALVPDLKPTAGYWQDAKRWLKQAGPALSPADRAALIRIA